MYSDRVEYFIVRPNSCNNVKGLNNKKEHDQHTVRVHTIRRGAMLCCKSVVKAEEARLQQSNGTISCDRITLVYCTMHNTYVH